MRLNKDKDLDLITKVTLNSNLEVNYSVENETERPEVIRDFLERIMSL